ncbi:MFS transporter [Arthrobacter sp.]|uniref:MFS transporter n=1 Tax=Arthrobacter sp. TaxID=1667 RepID=UPI00339212FB
MDQQPAKLWTKNFILAIVVNLFIAMVFYLLMTTMALYAVDRFQASDTAAGFASSAFVLGSVIARIFAGRLLDIVGRRRLILVTMAVFVVASLLYVPTGSLAWLLVLRIGHGMAFGAGTTAVAASAQSLIPHTRRGEGTGYFGLSTTLSTAVGPFLGVLLAGLGNYNAMFYFCAAASVAALLVALFLRVPELPATTRPGRFRMTLSDIFETAALPISCVILLAGASYSGILTFLTSYAETRGSTTAASVFFMVYAGAVLVSRLLAGRIQDRRGDNTVMYPTLISFVLGLLLLVPEPTILTIIGSAIFSGIGFGTVLSSAQAIAVKVSPTLRIGTATSTFFLMLDIGGGLGPIVLGALIPVLDYPGMYLLLAVVMVLATLLYFFAHGRSGGRAVRA